MGTAQAPHPTSTTRSGPLDGGGGYRLSIARHQMYLSRLVPADVEGGVPLVVARLLAVLQLLNRIESTAKLCGEFLGLLAE